MFVKLNNLKVHYKVIGQGDAILLLHGWGQDMHYFDKLQRHLALQFKVYVVDLPGFGLSTMPEKIWGTIEYADLIAQFIQKVNIVSPILMGHSFGGKIIINLVGRNLIQVKKIVLLSSSGIKLPQAGAIKLKIYVFKALKVLCLLPIIKSIFRKRIEFYKRKLGSNDYRNSSGLMRAILVKLVAEDMQPLLPLITVPTLLLWGDQDTSTPLKMGETMNKLITNAKLKVFAGGGHFLLDDYYDSLVLALDDFLK